VVSTIASQREGSRFDPPPGAFLCGVCMFACVCVGSLQVLQPSKNMHVRLIGDSKIVLRSECECAWLFVLFILCVAL